MSSERTLPKKRNPLLAPERTPHHAELISIRRLGQTDLSVRPGQIGTSNATKPENLGIFDYAHLRAPLPDNLKSSEIFAPVPGKPNPGAYFLMRRSSDGYISATGMFKVSFPWAKHAEESAEREYLKTLVTTSQDEVAGNVWIPESYALQLAEEYGITPWIKALLDGTPVPVGTDEQKGISPPPKFIFTASNDKVSLPPPGQTPARGRGRPKAASPSKTPGHKGLASPRKSRNTKAVKGANAITAKEAIEVLQETVENANAVSQADTESVDDEKVTVEVDSAIEVNGDTEVTHTKVTVKMPAHSPDLPLPDSTEEMIAKAKEMVEEARKMDGESSSSASKRKAMELDDEEDEVQDAQLMPAKRARLLEQEVRKQRVKQRALIGVAATLAIGAIMPFVFGG